MFNYAKMQSKLALYSVLFFEEKNNHNQNQLQLAAYSTYVVIA